MLWPAGQPNGELKLKELRMPKLKTKSSLKKRFSRTGTGKIKFKPAGKRHGMSKRSNKFIRNTKKSTIMSPGDAALINHMLPYNK